MLDCFTWPVFFVAMNKKTKQTHTIEPGTPFSPEAPDSPWRRIQRERMSSYWKLIICGSIHDEMPAAVSGITSCYTTLGPAGPESPLAPSRPLKPCTQNQSATSGQSPLIATKNWNLWFLVLNAPPNSLCVPWCRGVQGFRGIHGRPAGGKQEICR